MNKTEFIKNYGIKDASPTDPSLKIITAEGFSAAVEEFINERFRGVARVSSSVSCSDEILISPEYAAMFLKTLLAEVYGRCLIGITIRSDNERLTLTVSTEGEIPLDDCKLRGLIRLGRSSGMLISLEGGEIIMSATFSEAVARRVYAISVNDGRRTMLSKLTEIFYCGEEYR